MSVWGKDACVEAAHAAAALAQSAWLEAFADDSRPAQALVAAQDWLRDRIALDAAAASEAAHKASGKAYRTVGSKSLHQAAAAATAAANCAQAAAASEEYAQAFALPAARATEAAALALTDGAAVVREAIRTRVRARFVAPSSIRKLERTIAIVGAGGVATTLANSVIGAMKSLEK